MEDRPKAAPVLVGRDGELAELLAGLDDAASGSGRLFLLAGDPGIGKSRLAGEAAARARDRGIKVVWGRCWEAGGAPAYWPWVQALRALVRGVGSEELRSQLGAGAPFVAQIVAEVAEILPDVRPPPPMGAEGARFRLFDAVAAFLRNAAAGQPLVLVLDDLHAADAPSILLLRFVARELGDARVLVLGAYRDIELDRGHPLTVALAELSRESATRHVPLCGLDEAGVARLIQEITGVIPREGVVAAVRHYTEGNPLFVGEVVRLLAAEGRLERAGDPAGLRLAIPEGIREVIGRRVARLPEQCGRVLCLASMFGRDFWLHALEQLSGVCAGELLDILEDGIAADMVAAVPGAPGRLRFTHALIRDTLYESIPDGQRLRLHQQAGEALETLYTQDLDPHLAELAHHFFEAAAGGGAGKAVSYSARAGQRAMALLAYEEAARLFQMALAALALARSPGEDQARCRLLLALGDALTRMGERQAAREELRRAEGIARRYRLAEELGRVALAYAGRTFERGASDRHVITLLEDARALLAEDEGPLRARILAHLAVALRDQPDRGPRDGLSREAVALARTLDDPLTLAYTLACRVNALMGPGDPQERLAIAEELRAVARVAQDKELENTGEHHRAMVFLQAGRMAEYREALDAAQRLAVEQRQPGARCLATVVEASLALLVGRFADAEALVESALRFGASSVPWDAVIFSRVQLFALRSEDGRLAEMEPAIRRSVEEFPTRPLFRCLLAGLLTELGEEDQARSAFEQLAADRFAGIPVNNDLLLSLSHLAEVAWFLRDADRGALLHGLLLPYRGLVVDTLESSTGAVDRYLGLTAMTAGDLQAAERHLQDALRLNDRIGARPWTARTQRDLASVLLARDQPGDREQAVGLLASALGTARRLGMTAFAERAREDLASAGEEALAGDPERAGPLGAKAPGAKTSWSVCRREGEYWSIAFAGEAFRLKDVKGLHYLAHLLRHPGREYHVLDLAAAGQGGQAGSLPISPARDDDLHHARLSDTGPVLDEQAKTAYRARLRELEEELAEATSWANPVRAAKARQEMQFLADQLAAAVGLGGRDRRAGSPAERARVNITRAVRSALRRIRAYSPALADHLDATIHTGTFCSYLPDPRAPITWHT